MAQGFNNQQIDKKKAVIVFGLIAAIGIGGFILTKCTHPFKDSVTKTETQKNNDNQDIEDEGSPDIYAMQQYLNNKVLTVKDSYGRDVTVGVNDSIPENNGTGLVLAPTYSLASNDYKIGYQIVDDIHDMIEYSVGETNYTMTSPELSEVSNVCVDWTYDKLKPAGYNNVTDYGVKWHSLSERDKNTISNLKLLIIDMETHKILSSLTIEITRNNDNKYEITNLYNNDVSVVPDESLKNNWNLNYTDLPRYEKNYETGEITAHYMAAYDENTVRGFRQTLIDKAVAEIQSQKHSSSSEPLDVNTAVVELSNLVYHNKYLTYDHAIGYKSKTIKPVWAVTINSTASSIGHYTFYFTKEEMECIGCDYIWINTEDQLKNLIKE